MNDEATVEYSGPACDASFSSAIVRVVGTDEVVRIESACVIGSGDGAGLRVADRLVSRVHAELAIREDGLWVRDLGSRNGTFVDGMRVGSARIPHKGVITIGSTRIETEIARERRPVWPESSFGPLIGSSPQMREMFLRLARIAASDAPAFIHGETGTGKELVARAIHEASPRAKRPFVIVDCGALPANLLESELFGHARGAFTGAVTNHQGAVEVAEDGTVFLDEIGELPLDVQPKLLRALENRTFRRLGETQHRPIRARFLTATHRDLAAMVNARTFREDLFFRLNVLPVSVPPLRERREDIPLIVEALLARHDAGPLNINLEELRSRPWMGNVRELRTFVERVLTLGTQDALTLNASTGEGPVTNGFPFVDVTLPFKEIRDVWNDYLEKTYIETALNHHGGNVTAVAEGAGLARSYVHRLIRKHRLDR